MHDNITELLKKTARKKLLTKSIAGDKINRLSLETTTKKNKKVVDKDKCF